MFDPEPGQLTNSLFYSVSSENQCIFSPQSWLQAIWNGLRKIQLLKTFFHLPFIWSSVSKKTICFYPCYRDAASGVSYAYFLAERLVWCQFNLAAVFLESEQFKDVLWMNLAIYNSYFQTGLLFPRQAELCYELCGLRGIVPQILPFSSRSKVCKWSNLSSKHTLFMKKYP